MFKRIFVLGLMLMLTIIGCGTDTKTTYFTNMFKDEGDIDRLTACLTETPQVDGDTVIVKSNIQCLTELSNIDTSDPNISPSFSEILKNPEAYMDKLVTFEARVKKLHGGEDYPELFTNDINIKFYIISHGADVRVINDDGSEVPLAIGEKYRFRCRIYEKYLNIDRGGFWEVKAEFVVTSENNKTIVYPPEPVIPE